MLELIIIILIGVGILYATFVKHPLSFDELFELKFLPSRRKSSVDIEEIRAKINPRGVCLRRGQVNNTWGHQRCDCTGYRYRTMRYGQALCECGDFYLQHSPMGSRGDHGDPIIQDI